MNVIFTEYAQQELVDAIRYFERELPGLGQRFETEVKRGVARIVDYPDAWAIERGEIRKCLLYRFPYKLLYAIDQGNIIVLAVAHQHRKPDYWVERDER